MARTRLAGLFGITLALHFGSSQTLAQDQEGVEATLDSLVHALMVEFDVPAVALSVVRDGRVTLERAYGVSEASGRDADVTTLFNVASLSKPVTAIGILRLASLGLIDLDAPIGAYLTSWEFPASEFDPSEVTVARVVNHVAGLSLPGWAGYGPTDPLPSLEAVLTGTDTRPGVRIAERPGTSETYSGGGYALLQLLIEDVTGESFESFMRREVLRPLGMEHATFEDPVELPADTHLATPSKYLGQWLPQERFRAVAAAGLLASASDATGLLLFELGQVGDSILTDSLAARMLEPRDPSGSWAAGHIVRRLDDDLVVGHTGVNVGWRASFQIAPAARSGVAIFTNSDTGEYLISGVVCEWARHLGYGGGISECSALASERTARARLRAALGARPPRRNRSGGRSPVASGGSEHIPQSVGPSTPLCPVHGQPCRACATSSRSRAVSRPTTYRRGINPPGNTTGLSFPSAATDATPNR